MLDIHSLEFKYANSEKYVLKNINLKVNSGEYISVVGENGCGKSTLCRLAARFWDVNRGKIVKAAERKYTHQYRKNRVPAAKKRKPERLSHNRI